MFTRSLETRDVNFFAGGTLGLFVGMSILNFIEVFAWLVFCIKRILSAQKNNYKENVF